MIIGFVSILRLNKKLLVDKPVIRLIKLEDFISVLMHFISIKYIFNCKKCNLLNNLLLDNLNSLKKELIKFHLELEKKLNFPTSTMEQGPFKEVIHVFTNWLLNYDNQMNICSFAQAHTIHTTVQYQSSIFQFTTYQPH